MDGREVTAPTGAVAPPMGVIWAAKNHQTFSDFFTKTTGSSRASPMWDSHYPHIRNFRNLFTEKLDQWERRGSNPHDRKVNRF